jgi:hypothetical protein
VDHTLRLLQAKSDQQFVMDVRNVTIIDKLEQVGPARFCSPRHIGPSKGR